MPPPSASLADTDSNTSTVAVSLRTNEASIDSVSGVGGARNVVHGTMHGRSMTAFDYHYVLLSDSVESTGYERDSLKRFLMCVIDLDHLIPDLAAVQSDWFEWHDGELPGSIIDVDHGRWSSLFTLSGEDIEFAQAVLTDDNTARCLEGRTSSRVALLR